MIARANNKVAKFYMALSKEKANEFGIYEEVDRFTIDRNDN